MSPSESRSGSNPNRVRIFGPDKLVRAAAEKRWDRVKIVCSQPYSKVPGVEAEACPGQVGDLRGVSGSVNAMHNITVIMVLGPGTQASRR